MLAWDGLADGLQTPPLRLQRLRERVAPPLQLLVLDLFFPPDRIECAQIPEEKGVLSLLVILDLISILRWYKRSRNGTQVARVSCG